MAKASIERQLVDKGEGCLGKADDDEPVWIMRAQDLLFLPTLTRWIQRAENLNVNPDKLREAHKTYMDAADWQDKHQDRVKVPD